MSARYIKIGSCGKCPHRDHKGGFAVVKFVPVCRLMNRAELPHTVSRAVGSGTMAVVVMKDISVVAVGTIEGAFRSKMDADDCATKNNIRYDEPGSYEVISLRDPSLEFSPW